VKSIYLGIKIFREQLMRNEVKTDVSISMTTRSSHNKAKSNVSACSQKNSTTGKIDNSEAVDKLL
jgi:hypothetical protein